MSSTKMKKRRALLHKEQKGLCAYCSEPVILENSTVDHLKPKSKGGTDARENLVMACAPCNLTVGNFQTIAELDEYYHKVKRIIKIKQSL